VKNAVVLGTGVCAAGAGIYALCGTGGKAPPERKALSPGTVEIPPDLQFFPEKRGMPAPVKEAMFYEKQEGGGVQCRVCFRECSVGEGDRGFCGNKVNRGGVYYQLAYGRPSALQLDPVEKEPCFHMLPGMRILCTGTAGCNNRCKFCHNWHLSQSGIEEIEFYEVSPRDIANMALKHRCGGLSFTYNEPTTFYEFMWDTAREGKKAGLKVLFHSNGGMKEEPMKKMLEVADAVTVDLKGFSQKFYGEVSGSELKPVLSTLKTIKKSGVHLEIVNLVIPTLNDDMKDIGAMCRFVRDDLSRDTPIHFNRFHPSYKLKKLPPTPLETLDAARKTAVEAGLEYVYVGNLPGHRHNSTFCPGCGEMLVERRHFEVFSSNVAKGRCPKCSKKIPGVWA